MGLGSSRFGAPKTKKADLRCIFLAAPKDEGRALSDKAPILELTYNCGPEDYGAARNIGHLALPPQRTAGVMPNTGTW